MAQEIRAEEFFGKASRRRPEEFEFVRYRVEGPVARMTLDRPQHNLLNEPMLRELSAGIESLGEKDDVKLVVLDAAGEVDRKSTRLNSSHRCISYAVFCLKK